MGLDDAIVFGIIAVGGYVVYKSNRAKQIAQGSTPTLIKKTTILDSSGPILPQSPLVARATYIDQIPNSIPAPKTPVPSNLSQLYVEGTVLSKLPANSNYLTPDGAYKLIQEGHYLDAVKNKKISKYYYWSDVITPPFDPVPSSKWKSLPLSMLQNAYRTCLALDALCDRYSKARLTINSFLRPGDPKLHGKGLAADLGVSYAYAKQGGNLFVAARHTPELNGIGYPTRSSQNSLHVDIGHSVSPGYQGVFIDNGRDASTGTGFQVLPVLR